MKSKLLKIAVAGAMLSSSSAFALGPTVTPDLEIWMSGATAQDGNVEALFTTLCKQNAAGTGPADLDIYRDNSNPQKLGSLHRAFFCTVDRTKFTPNLLADVKVLFHKRSAGGSAMGVSPLVADTPIEHMVINNGNCTKNATSGEYECRVTNPGDVALHKSDGGVSDVEPGQFNGGNTPAGFAPVTAAVANSVLNITPAAALTFNTPVNTILRDALQNAQVASGSLPADCNLAANRELERCMPSLTKEQVAALFTGDITDWTQFQVKDATTGTVNTLDSFSPVALSNTVVHVCRRVPGSGTQAQFNINFLRHPCAANSTKPARASFPFSTIVENSGSGNVEGCLVDFNNGTNLGNTGVKDAAGNLIPNNPFSETAFAIGVQSTEKNALKNGVIPKDYRFIKIDGVAPTIENAILGKYWDWVEQTFQVRKPAKGGPTGDKLTILQTIFDNAANPTVVSATDVAKFTHTWGVGGFMSVPTGPFNPEPNGQFNISNPVIPYTHAPGGLTLDNCRTPTPENLKFINVNL